MSFFSLYDSISGKSNVEHNLRLHTTIEAFVTSLDTKKLIKKCLISENPQGASKLSLLSGNVMQAFEFTLQSYVKAGLVGTDIFQAFIYFLHHPMNMEDQDVEVKRQLLERLIACWQDQKFSFVQLENLFIQNFDALLLQILVLTLFRPNDERSVDDGPVLNNEASGRPKLADLFTPEFCLKVGDTFINSIKNEENSPSAAVTEWLQMQTNANNPENLSNLVTGLVLEAENHHNLK